MGRGHPVFKIDNRETSTSIICIYGVPINEASIKQILNRLKIYAGLFFSTLPHPQGGVSAHVILSRTIR